MRPQSILLGAICLLVAPVPNGSQQRVQALIAIRDIEPMEWFNSTNTRIVMVKADPFDRSILRPNACANCAARVRIPKGCRVTLDNVTYGLGQYLPLGHRTVTVRVTGLGVVSPRERVNLVVRFKGFTDSPPILLMHNVEVFAVDVYASPGSETNLSVLLTPEGAYELLKARKFPDTVCEVETFNEPPQAARVRVGFFE